MVTASSTPPGAFPQPQPAAPIGAADEPIQTTGANKKKKKKKKGGAGPTTNSISKGSLDGGMADYGQAEESDDDLPPLEEVEDPYLTPAYQLPSSTHMHSRGANTATAVGLGTKAQSNTFNTSPNDLLSTASDLYRQIEAAAASALSTHPSFAAGSFPNPPLNQQGQPQVPLPQINGGGNTTSATDEAYWTSLPQHLRQFIRSALPLAAGLTNNNSMGGNNSQAGDLLANGGHLPPLTHDQLSSAAAQLAQVVQSNWGQLGLGPMPASLQSGGPLLNGGANVSQHGSGLQGQGNNGSSISLGNFPVSMPTREQMEAAIGSMGGMGMGEIGIKMGLGTIGAQTMGKMDNSRQQQSREGEHTGEETDEEDYQNVQNLTNPLSESIGEDGQQVSAAAKKKNKKKKKKANAAQQQSGEQAAPQPLTNAPLRAPAPKAAVPAVPYAPAAPLVIANGKGRAMNLGAAPPPPPPFPPSQNNGKGVAVQQPYGQQHYSGQGPPGSYPHSVPSTAPSNQQLRTVQSNHQGVTPSIAPKAGPSSEREKIRDFWLGLKENERRALVKVEKEAVLRKMKEQQRSGCSCAVCGRKRSAIEEELEVLYDAYYDELESYALHQVRYASSGGTIPPPPGPGPFPGSVDASANVSPPVKEVKKAILKTTRDHKNVRPAAATARNKKAPPPVSAISNNLPPSNNNLPLKTSAAFANADNGPAHGEPGHTHSPSCPHHPHNHHGHNHGHSHGHPTSAQAKAKGAVIMDQECYDEEDGDDDDEEDFEDEDEEEYDDDGDDEDYDEEDDLQDADDLSVKKGGLGRKLNGADGGADFFGFGKSLTVKGGILTVADDLLKNDGQKFLEMMEQLADKRIQREREAAEGVGTLDDDEGSEEDYDDEDEDEDGIGDEDGDDDDDDDDDEVMTEAERMEEGRRMFQIFAARMFEQRVLNAYREKVASERQIQLLRELEEEERLAEEKELKKAKENQKKKDKKKDQKQKKEEERLRKEAEKEAAEKTLREAEEARLEEERRRNEEQRVKREAEKRAKEDERLKREEKLRQAKEEERMKKDEKLRQAKEAKLALEKEQKSRKAKEEADKKAKEAAERKAREDKAEKERLEKEREREMQAGKERQASAEAARLQAAAAQAASKAKVQQQTTTKSTLAPRNPPATTKPAVAIPGLPRAQAAASKAAVNPQQQSTSMRQQPPSLQTNVNVRKPTTVQLAQAQPLVSMQQQRQAPSGSSPLTQQQIQQSQVPSYVQRSPPGAAQANPLPTASLSQSRLFPSPPGSQAFRSNVQQQNPVFVQHSQSQQPSLSHISPVMSRNAPTGHPQTGPSVASAPRATGPPSVGLIGAPAASFASASQISGGGLNNGPTELSATSPRPANVGPIGGIIGRPSSSISGVRSASPPPRIFGSSALLEDDEVVEPSRNASQQSASANWSSPYSAGIWGAPSIAAPPPIVSPDRNSVIRDRARVSYLKLDELSNGTNAPIAIGDVHRALITLWPDSVSIDLKEMVESMLQEGNILNGGGSFSFTQRGEGLYAQFSVTA